MIPATTEATPVAVCSVTTLELFSLLVLIALLTACAGPVRAPVYGKGSQAEILGSPAGRQKPRPAAYYKVRAGDTLYAIAWRYGRDFRELARWNAIRPPYVIYPGQRLRLTPVARPRRQKTLAARTGSEERHKRERDHVKGTGERVKASPDSTPVRPLKWRWPARGRILQLQSPLGVKGVDIRGKRGQAVLATESGEVVYSGSGLIGYGRLIIIKHNDMFLSAYAHNSSLYVKEGDHVRAGQKIAAMGSSGSDVVALHFEIRRNGKPVPPLEYLPPK